MSVDTRSWDRDRVLASVPRLTPLKLAKIFAALDSGGLGNFTPGQALVLWIAHYLLKDARLTMDQQDLIISRFGHDIEDYGDEVWNVDGPDIKVGCLTVYDGGWASMSGKEKWLDLRTGRLVEVPAVMPFHASSYNLAALLALGKGRLSKK